jgi:ABC-2 type transport system ATP-binding protein
VGARRGYVWPTPMTNTKADAPVIRAENLGKAFNDVWVVRDLTFTVNRKEIFCLLGPSGSGKTTTLRMLLGVFPPDEGRLEVFGKSLREQGAIYANQVGYLSQLFVLYPNLSIQENLNFIGLLYGMSLGDRRKRIHELLELVELGEHRNKTAGRISGGMQRRLGLAAAMMHRPQILFVDEPTAGIVPILREKFWDEFRRLNQDEGTTIIVTTQYVTEAEYCDDVVILSAGGMAAAGTPNQLREQALGGEIVEIKTTGLASAAVSQLYRMERVNHIDGPNRIGENQHQMLLTVEGEAETLMRDLMQMFEGTGTQVDSIGEVTPNFDEVFVRLVRRYEDLKRREPAKR